jgi:hypothetical protein
MHQNLTNLLLNLALKKIVMEDLTNLIETDRVHIHNHEKENDVVVYKQNKSIILLYQIKS